MIRDAIQAVARDAFEEKSGNLTFGPSLRGTFSFFNESICIKNLSSRFERGCNVRNLLEIDPAFLSKIEDWEGCASHVLVSFTSDQAATAFNLSSVVRAERYSLAVHLELGPANHFYCPIAHDAAALGRAFPRRRDASADSLRDWLKLGKNDVANLSLLPAQFYLLRPQTKSIRVTRLSGYLAKRSARMGNVSPARRKKLLESRLEKWLLSVGRSEIPNSGRVNARTGRYQDETCPTSHYLLRSLMQSKQISPSHDFLDRFAESGKQVTSASSSPMDSETKIQNSELIQRRQLYRRKSLFLSEAAIAGWPSEEIDSFKDSAGLNWDLLREQLSFAVEAGELAYLLTSCLRTSHAMHAAPGRVQAAASAALDALQRQFSDEQSQVLLRKSSVAIDVLNCTVALWLLLVQAEAMAYPRFPELRKWTQLAIESLFDRQIHSPVSEYYVRDFLAMKGAVVMSAVDPSIDIVELARCWILLKAVPAELLHAPA